MVPTRSIEEGSQVPDTSTLGLLAQAVTHGCDIRERNRLRDGFAAPPSPFGACRRGEACGHHLCLARCLC